MNKERNQNNDTDEQPLTATVVIKWFGIIFTIVSTVISLVWFAALLKGDISTVQQEHLSSKREYELKIADIEKKIDKLSDRADITEKSVIELMRKLDVAVAILERIDKKVEGGSGRPN